MKKTFELSVSEYFNYHLTLRGHGWYSLSPFELTDTNILTHTGVYGANNSVSTISISESGGKLRVKCVSGSISKVEAVRAARHILRLDEDFGQFYRLIEQNAKVTWAMESRAGRMLRSPTVWEDLVKTICTTNCTWALTRSMVSNLVETLGESSDSGKKAFPTAEVMAAQTESFYRDEIRAGYRSPYFIELAESVAAKKLDIDDWLTTTDDTAALKKRIKAVKGVGDYAAENLLKLIGRYDGLALDSYLRGRFYLTRNNGKKCKDSKIERYYKNFGPWRGLAIWCDMTEDWFDLSRSTSDQSLPVR